MESVRENQRKMPEQTQTIGKEAAQLSRALRSDTKVQGDWGEMVLARILDSSGLRQGEEYEVQKNYKTEDGKDVRPDSDCGAYTLLRVTKSVIGLIPPDAVRTLT